MPDKLPIYRLEPSDTSTARLLDVGKSLFNLKQDFKISETGSSRALRDGQYVVEIYPASGGIWAADETRLWQTSQRPELPEETEAIVIAEQLLREKKLLPKLDKPFRFGRPVVGGTFLALQQNKKRENHRLDVQVVYPVMVGDLPVVGGGADFTLTLGHKADIIGFSGGWRPAKEAFASTVIDRTRADEQFNEITKGMKIESFNARLAYYAAPAFSAQEFLYPVYVYSATAIFGKQKVPLRQIMLPATEFGPQLKMPKLQRGRKKLARPAHRGKEKKKEQPRRHYSVTALAPTRPWEAGTSWIGTSGGLKGSQANAQGFVDEWAAAGWHIDFNWGDADAWESDWRKNDDEWVDNADFVFYTGHANMNGWVLASPDDGFLNFVEVGATAQTPGDLWGQSDLEWAVIAACGPLQDELISPGGGDVLDRWDGAFDGMHILMGYGAITGDNTEEGRRLAQYAKSGETLVNAWFRTAKEIQPSTNGEAAPDGPNVYVGAMWAGKGAIDPINDHAWDYGSVSADPTSPEWYAAMWTLC